MPYFHLIWLHARCTLASQHQISHVRLCAFSEEQPCFQGLLEFEHQIQMPILRNKLTPRDFRQYSNDQSGLCRIIKHSSMLEKILERAMTPTSRQSDLIILFNSSHDCRSPGCFEWKIHPGTPYNYGVWSAGTK